MTVKQFFKAFKNVEFYYEASGAEGGKSIPHHASFELLGYCGLFGSYANTFTFKIVSKTREDAAEIVKFARIDWISDIVMNMEIIDIESIILNGNNRTRNNYWNDFSSFTFIVAKD